MADSNTHHNTFNQALKFYQYTDPEKFPLVYEGEVNQQIIKTFASNIQLHLEAQEESSMVVRRVYHVMVETLQNMTRHADDWFTGESAEKSRGLIVFQVEPEHYTITTGNLISKQHVGATVQRLEEVNGLDKDGIKALYKKRIREGSISDRGGAGLGFIDMAKKTGNSIAFSVEPANDKVDYLLLKVRINR